MPPENARPVALTVVCGKKEECEVSEGRALLAKPKRQLVNTLLPADPLDNKEAAVLVLLVKGGD